jgi:plasmid stabilization system protein ParE
MSYEVALTERAEAQLDDAFAWWREHRSGEQAARWYNSFADAIAALAENPARHPRSAESATFPYEIRDLHFGLGRRPSHRAVFTIRDDLVLVLAIRHVAQRPMTGADV